MSVRILGPCLALALVAPLWGRTQPANPDRTVQDGVFTEAQADRGQDRYESYCLKCHGEELTGANARALVGEDFLRNWTGLTLDGLLERAQTMPPGAAMSLDSETYVDIITYILETNGFPTGGDELRADTLSAVVVEGEDGPQEVPDHTLVQVVGCLGRGPSNTWIVTNASDPVRTRDPAASTEDARQVVASMPLGSGSYELLYVFPTPDSLVGHRVEVKGFLIRGEQNRINVTALESTAQDCTR